MLNLDEEKKILELKSICKELKIQAPMDIFITMKVEKQKKVLFEDVQRGHSWTRNYYNTMFSAATTCRSCGTNNFGAGYMTQKYKDNSIFYQTDYHAGPRPGYFSGEYGMFTSNATENYGIVVGTGTGAFSSNDYILNTLVVHGNSAGKLSYQPMAAPAAPVYTSGTKTWTAAHSRIFNNNSGGAIVVGETGLIVNTSCFYSWNNVLYPLLFERNVLSPTVSVGDGAQLTVTYTFSSDFSSVD